MKKLILAVCTVAAFVACGASVTMSTAKSGASNKGVHYVVAKITNIDRTCAGEPAVACRATVSFQVPCDAEYYRFQDIQDAVVGSDGITHVRSVLFAVILKQTGSACEPNSPTFETRSYQTQAFEPTTEFLPLESSPH